MSIPSQLLQFHQPSPAHQPPPTSTPAHHRHTSRGRTKTPTFMRQLVELEEIDDLDLHMPPDRVHDLHDLHDLHAPMQRGASTSTTDLDREGRSSRRIQFAERSPADQPTTPPPSPNSLKSCPIHREKRDNVENMYTSNGSSVRHDKLARNRPKSGNARIRDNKRQRPMTVAPSSFRNHCNAAFSTPQTRPLRQLSVLTVDQTVRRNYKQRAQSARSARATSGRVASEADVRQDSKDSGSGISRDVSPRTLVRQTSVTSTGEGGAMQRSMMIDSSVSGHIRSMYQRRQSVAASLLADCPSARQVAGHRSDVTPRLANTPEMELQETPRARSYYKSRFRMVAHVVLQLRSFMAAIIAFTRDNTPRSATELQWWTVYAEKQDDSLTFNKHFYSRDRVSTHIPDWASAILALPPEERTDQHCRRLHALLRGLRSFDKFTDEIQMAMCRAFTLDSIEEQRVVLKRGHIGLSFYVIYSGSVFVNAEDTTTNGEVFVRTVAVLGRGESFGELALLQNTTRTATVCVRERCELLVVEKDVFGSVCPRIFEKQLMEKQSFLNKLDLFSARWWSADSLRAMSMNSQIQEYQTNKIIVSNNSTEDWIYTCMEGQCQVIRCLSLATPIKSDKRKTSDIVLSEEILQLLSNTPAEKSSSNRKMETGDMKSNLLTSLGLDYVSTGKKMNFDMSNTGKGSGGDATTLTEVMRRQKDNKDLVYLHVGKLDVGQTFDLGSLFNPPHSDGDASALMLVSGGSKMLKLKKGAFFGHASDKALDHTRVLARKQGVPTEDVILDSYKIKVAWEDFKIDAVNSVLKAKDRRIEPMYRVNDDPQRFNHTEDRQKTTSRIMTALQRHRSGSSCDIRNNRPFSGVTTDIRHMCGSDGISFKPKPEEEPRACGRPSRHAQANVMVMSRKPNSSSGSTVKITKDIKTVSDCNRPGRSVRAVT